MRASLVWPTQCHRRVCFSGGPFLNHPLIHGGNGMVYTFLRMAVGNAAVAVAVAVAVAYCKVV